MDANSPKWVPYKKGEAPEAVDGEVLRVLSWDTIEQVMEAVERLPDDEPNFTGGYKHKHGAPRENTQSDRNAYNNRLARRRSREKNRRQKKLQSR